MSRHSYRITLVGPTGYSECVEISAADMDEAEWCAENIRRAEGWVHAQIDTIDGFEVDHGN